MALNIKDHEVDQLVRALAAETGESITVAVKIASRERLERLRATVPRERRKEAILRTLAKVDRLPILDDRSANEILGYGPDGIPA